MSDETPETPEIRDPAALLKAHEELKNDFKSLKSAHETLQAQIKTQDTDNPWKARAIKAETMVELNKRGIKNTNIAKYINTDDLDLDEEGNIAGLTERIDAAASEFPEIFDVKRSVGGKVDSFRSTPTNVAKSDTEMQVSAIFDR